MLLSSCDRQWMTQTYLKDVGPQSLWVALLLSSMYFVHGLLDHERIQSSPDISISVAKRANIYTVLLEAHHRCRFLRITPSGLVCGPSPCCLLGTGSRIDKSTVAQEAMAKSKGGEEPIHIRTSLRRICKSAMLCSLYHNSPVSRCGVACSLVPPVCRWA